MNLSGMAMTEAAPHPAEALRLMEFLTSEQAQELYAEINYEYPLIEGASPSDLVASWGAFTPDPTPLTDIAAKRSEAVRLIERVDFDG